MAMQTAKFIDVNRTYMPCDPRTFMESLQIPGPQEAPESRTPVMPYYGRNFLPTGYGYKSYFGLNQEVNIDALPGIPDFVFIYQNNSFVNVLVALCHNGIWVKKGSTTGAWIQVKAITPPVNPAVHYDWTYCMQDNNLYCYMQGKANYQKISSILADPGVSCTDQVPTFLNMAGQLGIFRAGGRLGFWDSEDSVGWSSLDDFTNFTPSLVTLAGNSKWKDVKGRITTIQSHGDGFMIYATKSIVYVNPTPTQEYQWDPIQVVNNAGVAYPRQIAIGTPDSEHFVWTTVGLFKITRATPELIVPTVSDFLREQNVPVYLRMLEGRHLFVESLDPDFLQSQVNFSEGVVDPLVYEFPDVSGTLQEAVEDSLLTGTSICYPISKFGQYPDQFTAPVDMKPGTTPTPVYTCYLSNNGNKDIGNIVWGTAPCGPTDVNGVAVAMSPQGVGGKLSGLTTNTTNKTAVSGADAYIDGKWTMERFVQAQSLLWDMEEENLSAYVNAIIGKASFTEKYTDASSCVESTVVSNCDLGTYVTKFSGRQFGFNQCSFWLTRYAIGAQVLKTRRTYKMICTYKDIEYVSPTQVGYRAFFDAYCTPGLPDMTLYPYGSAAAACASLAGGIAPNAFPTGPTSWQCGPGAPNPMYTACSSALCPVGWNRETYVDGWRCSKAAHWERHESVSMINVATDLEIAPTPETAFCIIAGYNYTKNDNTQGYVGAGACTPMAAPIFEENMSKPFLSVGEKDGEFCSIPFQPVTIPGTPAVTYDWPNEDLVIPGGVFLLQDGSPAPVYPTLYGAITYDTHLKKWGNMQQTYKLLIDYSPINGNLNGAISYSNFGVKGGVITVGGKIRLFDAYPLDSSITWGKVGYYRLGMTSPEEVRVDFRSLSTGTLRVHSSLDGRNLATEFVTEKEFENANTVILTGAYPGRWADITVEGIYDVTYMEYRGKIEGRR